MALLCCDIEEFLLRVSSFLRRLIVEEVGVGGAVHMSNGVKVMITVGRRRWSA